MQNYSLNQAYIFLIFIITGLLIGILFDIFRILRKSFKTSDFITYVQDMLFWTLAGFLIIFSIYKFNSGEIRIFIFVGLLLGIIFYLLTISKYFITINVKIITFISKVFKKVFICPIRFIFKVINKIIIRPISRFFYKICQNSSKKIKNIVKNKNKFKKKVANKEDFKV